MAMVHLFVIQPSFNPEADEEPRLISEGRYGCDYAWNADFTAYRCMPHRWLPGSDSSYAAWQAGVFDENAEIDETQDDGAVGWSADMFVPNA